MACASMGFTSFRLTRNTGCLWEAQGGVEGVIAEGQDLGMFKDRIVYRALMRRLGWTYGGCW